MDEDALWRTVVEQDIDRRIAKLLEQREDFAQWLVNRFVEGFFVRGLEVQPNSSRGDGREMDLFALAEDVRGRRLALLIENKINAEGRTNQARDHHKYSESGVDRGCWEDFRVILMAPASYLQGRGEARSYRWHLPYEDLLEWEAHPEFCELVEYVRAGIRANQEKGRRMSASAAFTEFYDRYLAYVKERFPHLYETIRGRDRLIKSTDEGWVYFAPREMGDPVGGRRHQIVHKFCNSVRGKRMPAANQTVDLHIARMGYRLDELRGLPGFEPDRWRAPTQTQSPAPDAIYPVPTAPLHPEDDFDEEAVREALENVEDLFSRWLKVRHQVDEWEQEWNIAKRR